MTGKIRLSKSSISQMEKDAVLGVLDREYLGIGQEVMGFEKRIESFLGTEMKAACVNSGTAALHLALSALGIGQNDEVLVPSLTFVATFQAISALGAKPVACEIDPETLFLDAVDAEKKITERTKVILPVHYASSSKGIEEVYELALRYRLRVVEDAAQSFGSRRAGKLVGMQGDVVCFSFDGIKNITAGEGGAVVSGDADLIRRVQDARLLGVERDTEQRYQGLRSWDFDVKMQGFRYHMSNIMAAIGMAQLDRIEAFKEKRQLIAKTYVDAFAGIAEIDLLAFDFEEIMPHIFVVKADRRDELRNYLIERGIECGIHYKPNHLLSLYKTGISLPKTEAIYDRIITLPCHFDLSSEDQNRVINTVLGFYGLY